LHDILTPGRAGAPAGGRTPEHAGARSAARAHRFKRANSLRQANTPIQRRWTGAMWSEGPAWSGVGRFLFWSDIPNNRQLRWLEDTGQVSVYRLPSNNSNGNTFDF
jgi:sugar lactone lactonase YvrE